MSKNIIIILFAAILFGSSCEDFLSVNENNPNKPSEVAPKLILPDALNQVARIMNNPRNFDFVYLWHGLWSISSGYTQPTALTQYRITNSNYQNPFNFSYLAGQNFYEIEKASLEDPRNANYLAIAKIMTAYLFQNLVDCYGDVPYSEAFKADEGFFKPKYDAQQDIYEDLVVKLDEAMSIIQNAPADVYELNNASDIIYAGDMSLWLKFANTLKLRILIHQSGMSGRDTYISSNIATTASIGYLGAGESALANPGYLVSDGKMNNFYETFYKANGSSQSDGITYYYAGGDVIDYMISTNDPRIGKYFKPYSGTSYGGNYFGLPGNELKLTGVTSQLGYITSPTTGIDPTTMIGAPTKSCPILTDFESLFIQAEAAERGFITADAQSLYNSAIAQSFAYMGTTGAGAYFAQDAVRYTAGNVNGILLQKWVALNGIAPVEVWTDYRRSGVPSFLHFSPDPAQAPEANGVPPVRLLYPQREIDTNNDQLLQVGTISQWTSKIFWQNR